MVHNWINEFPRDEWRSPREWQIIYYCQIDTAVEPQKLTYLTRLSYDLGIAYDDLFEFCHLFANRFFSKSIKMSEQCYKLEFSHYCELLKERGILRDGKVNGTNLWKVCAVMAKLDTQLTPAGWVLLVSRAICECHGIDGPWSWHFRRVLDKQQREAFEDPDYVRQFAEWYIAWINKMEVESFNECGVPIQSIVWKTPADSGMLR